MNRMLYLLTVSLLLALPACKTPQAASGTDANPRIGGSNNAPQSYYDAARQRGATTAVLAVSTDPEYGVSQKKPVCVAGISEEKVKNQHQHLNALRGPNGEAISYRRRGSCCDFKTRNGPIDGMGLLDVYALT